MPSLIDKCSPLKRSAECPFMHTIVDMSNKGEEEKHEQVFFFFTVYIHLIFLWKFMEDWITGNGPEVFGFYLHIPTEENGV